MAYALLIFISMTSSKTKHREEQVPFSQKERDYVFAIAMRILRNETEAEDATQEALLLAFRKKDSFRGDSQYSTWLYRVATTSALMHLRKRKRYAREVLEHSDENNEPREFVDTAASPEQTTADREAVVLIQNHLGKLGDKYNAIFWMRFAGGYRENEIAQALHLHTAAVKTRAYRARTAVREVLEQKLAA